MMSNHHSTPTQSDLKGGTGEQKKAANFSPTNEEKVRKTRFDVVEAAGAAGAPPKKQNTANKKDYSIVTEAPIKKSGSNPTKKDPDVLPGDSKLPLRIDGHAAVETPGSVTLAASMGNSPAVVTNVRTHKGGGTHTLHTIDDESAKLFALPGNANGMAKSPPVASMGDSKLAATDANSNTHRNTSKSIRAMDEEGKKSAASNATNSGRAGLSKTAIKKALLAQHEVKDEDVVWAREFGGINHAGYQNYMFLINDNYLLYHSFGPVQNEKMHRGLCKNIFDRVTLCGGRFLKKDKNNVGYFLLLTEKEALNKIAEALRNKKRTEDKKKKREEEKKRAKNAVLEAEPAPDGGDAFNAAIDTEPAPDGGEAMELPEGGGEVEELVDTIFGADPSQADSDALELCKEDEEWVGVLDENMDWIIENGVPH